MKSLVIIFLFLCVNIYSQSWNAIDTTDVPLNASSGTAERISLFGNHYGIHLLKTVYTGAQQQVKYYRLESTGELDTSGTLDTYGNFPNITGDENILYAVYRKSDTVKVQRSTDGGSHWAPLSVHQIFTNGGANCNGVDAAYSASRGLCLVWSEKVGNKYESYFARWDGDSWENFTSITNTAGVDSGGFPTVTTSSVLGVDRAHVSINTGIADDLSDNSGRSYSRDFNYTTWSSPVAIIPSGSVSRMDRLIVTGSYIHCFYYNTEAFPRLKYKRKSVTSSVWADSSEINSSVVYTGDTYKINVTKTPGDTLHITWVDIPFGIWHSKKHSLSNSWSTAFDVSNGGSQFRDWAITSASNDLFVMWTWQQINYRFRQYDAYPLKPTNLTVTKSSNLHPLLQWNRNNEPDVASYKIYKYVSQDQGWYYLTTTTSPSHEDLTESYCPPGQECIGGRTVTYKVTAVDLHPYESLASDSVITAVRGGVPQKYSGDNQELPDNHSLGQNYPNPFNPSTQITYALAEDAKVQIKVYDMLGTEVAELVNETKPAGFYETTFDASDLSSGVYIYRITALSGDKILFSQSKQMILLK